MRRPRENAQAGYILVAVLSVMLMLTGLIAAGSVLVRSALDGVKVDDSDVAMAGLTQGGLEIAAYQLFVVKAPPARISGRRIKFAGGVVAATVTDEGGKVDLNKSDPKLLAALFASTGMGASDVATLVARIVAMRGADKAAQTTGPSQTATAPQTSTTAAGEAPRLRGFQSVGQILELGELTRSDFHVLAPRLTVFNPDGKIDILTASGAVLQAIPGLTGPKVAEILHRRDGASKETIDSLQGMLEDAAAYTKTTPGPAYTLRIEATGPTGRKKAANAVVAASKSPNDPYYVLDGWD